MNREINAPPTHGVAAMAARSVGLGEPMVFFQKKFCPASPGISGRLAFPGRAMRRTNPRSAGQPGYNPLFPVSGGLGPDGQNGNVALWGLCWCRHRQ